MRSIIKWILLLLVGGFFLAAGALKLADLPAFAQSILHYRLVGAELAGLLALWLPWLEVAGGAAVLLRGWRMPGAILVLGLLLVFEIILASAYLRGLNIDCGCLGATGATSVAFAFVRNLCLGGALLAALQLDRRGA